MATLSSSSMRSEYPHERCSAVLRSDYFLPNCRYCSSPSHEWARRFLPGSRRKLSRAHVLVAHSQLWCLYRLTMLHSQALTQGPYALQKTHRSTRLVRPCHRRQLHVSSCQPGAPKRDSRLERRPPGSAPRSQHYCVTVSLRRLHW
jgi:hypothetical protein